MESQIEPNLYKTASKTYRKAVDEGFGTVKFGHPDYDFLEALKHNTDVLAAYKTHRQQNDLAALMMDENGKLKPFNRFRADVEEIIGRYNRNWMATEYNTAVVRARHAASWRDFRRDADLYPNLKWLETTSPHPDTKVHIHYWDRIWALNDPFWKKHYPGDRWNCKCGLANTDEPVTDNSDLTDISIEDQPDAGIDNNSGVSGQIFTDTHPYITEAYEGAGRAVKKLLGEIKEIRERRKDIAKEAEPLTKELIANTGLKQDIIVTKKTIKEWLNQPHKYYAEKNEMLLDIKSVIRDAEYMGWTVYHKSNPMITKSHIFKTQLGEDFSYIIVLEDVNGKLTLHSISDSGKVLNGIKK